MNSALEALQSDMQQHLLGHDSDIASALRPGGIGIARRLAIYHRAYRMRLLDTLHDSFGHTLMYLGDEHFDRAALAYIESHPSQHTSLRDYGDTFAPWLSQQFTCDAELGELAALDWALRHAFDGPDAAVIGLADLALVPANAWGGLRLVLHPTYARLRLHHNALALWHALDQDQTPPAAAALTEPGELLIWRRSEQPHFRSLKAYEAAALDAVNAGLSFAEVGAQLSAHFAGQQDALELAAELGALLRRWVDEGLLSAVMLGA